MSDISAFMPSDNDLIDGVVLGETKLFEELYNRYIQRVYLKCLRFTNDRDEAADLAQEIMLKIYCRLGDFKRQSLFSTWLFSVVNNYCIDFSRKQKSLVSKNKKVHLIQDEVCEMADVEEDEQLWILKFDILSVVLNEIPVLEKQLLLMKYSEGLSIQSIADSLGLKESVTKMRIKRAKDRAIQIFLKRKERLTIAA